MHSALVLASQSPRRRELLTLAGFDFVVEPANINEMRHAGEAPDAYVQRLALEKATAIADRFPEAIVLGADTTVVLDGEALNKPLDVEDARRMLLALAGRAHEVHTALAVVSRSTSQVHLETTRVFFSAIETDELATYLDSGDPLDKAGAYGIQGYASRWIPRIEGDYFNVVGLPIAATVRLLRDL
ncbi:MAG: Maf family protein [Acidobacteriaceae bacterium]|nr:Maf family protein [Acidobacteriaceae bacterium]